MRIIQGKQRQKRFDLIIPRICRVNNHFEPEFKVGTLLFASGFLSSAHCGYGRLAHLKQGKVPVYLVLAQKQKANHAHCREILTYFINKIDQILYLSIYLIVDFFFITFKEFNIFVCNV
ncbi:MAG: hypothetical protein A4E66_01706 [Syntrophus sp. PtaB.Bin001]|nr:MAG: hypothetical protein A4E66_01706 [Syntrophus sp. PtaB.Bin001]